MCFKRRDCSENSDHLLESKRKQQNVRSVSDATYCLDVTDRTPKSCLSICDRMPKSIFNANNCTPQKFEERIKLEDVIKWIRDDKKHARKTKCQTGELLTDVQICDQEIVEAEAR
ncbi:hypothetical protein Ddc_10352 [Ditylenchus destructor]|nr:hypothetical protein Ddc_10352 [Ditylenchus destructor]